MKFIFVAVFIGCIAAAVGDADEEAKFKQMGEACCAESGVDEEVCKTAKEGAFDDPKMPEYIFCVFKKMGFLNDAGEYQVEAIKKGLTAKFDADVANSIADECTKEAKGSGPENAMSLAKCYQDKAPKQ